MPTLNSQNFKTFPIENCARVSGTVYVDRVGWPYQFQFHTKGNADHLWMIKCFGNFIFSGGNVRDQVTVWDFI